MILEDIYNFPHNVLFDTKYVRSFSIHTCIAILDLFSFIFWSFRYLVLLIHRILAEQNASHGRNEHGHAIALWMVARNGHDEACAESVWTFLCSCSFNFSETPPCVISIDYKVGCWNWLAGIHDQLKIKQIMDNNFANTRIKEND